MTAPAHVAVGDLIKASYINNLDDFVTTPGQAYTPVLTAATTNPTLGAGSAQTGRWRQIGKAVDVDIRIAFGTSGTNPGSGAYFITLPVAGQYNVNFIIGHGAVGPAGLWTPVKVLYVNGSTVQLRYVSAAVNGAWTTVTNNTPGVFGVSDEIRLQVAYEAA